VLIRILHLVRHHEGNDDEGAITFALRQLGHEVIEKFEHEDHLLASLMSDFCLFHGFCPIRKIQDLRCPSAFWYFDLVDHRDPKLVSRSNQRIAWVNAATELSLLGFLTDGDWVAQDRTGKLRWLTQGFDERQLGKAYADLKHIINPPPPILFTGSHRGGAKRESFVTDMKERWGPRFNHIYSGVHGRSLADLIAASKIVVAPDSPVTDRYWSNRVYLTLGFGGFLLHPECKGLREMIGPADLIQYRDRQQLHSLIDTYLDSPKDEFRRGMAARGMEAVAERHLYRHRCEEMVRQVKEKL
jgi:hypothetical protein